MKKTSKEEILKEAIKLFKRQGYHNTSMANIGTSCGLIKGSIYHHFKNKEEIGEEALRYISEFFSENIFAIKNENLSTKKKLEKIVAITDEYFINSIGGCLLGNLASEVANQNDNFKLLINTYFQNWINCISEILNEQMSENEAYRLAFEYVSALQGAIIMFNLTNDKENYLSIGQSLINKV